MAPLDHYNAKRNFAKTSEPKGVSGRKRAKQGGLFAVQKHAATRLHYDLRLEHDGVLWSWAVTRGPSLDPSEKRLAVHVEDHPLAYGDFEGTIPEGEYGAGTVILWDEGVWQPIGDAAAGMAKGHIRFEIKANKLNGLWDLVRLKPRRNEKRENWLLIKADDSFARPGTDLLEDAPDSVKSGRGIDEVAEGDAPVWHSNKPAHKKATPAKTPRSSRSTKSAGKPLAFVPPCLARLESTAPEGAVWLHEVKFDGYRIQAHLHAGKVVLYTRSGLDWTDRFARIGDAVGKLDADDAVLDGEIVVLGENGVASFSELQADLAEGRSERMIYYVFDLLQRDGRDLRGETLLERKAQLRELVDAEVENGPLRFSEHFFEPGQTMLTHACRMGLEGVVSKRADAPYASGRGRDWVKSKCIQRQEFVIAGYVPSAATGRGLRSLVVGYHENGALLPAGRVGSGFTTRAADDLKQRLDRLKAKASALQGEASKERGVVWVEPKLVAEVEFRSWTRGGSLRHASFKGLREDKPADEVVAERPEKADHGGVQTGGRTPAKTGGKAKAKEVRTSISLSNPDKVLWPDVGLTKQGLLDYYAKVWPRMEPFVVNRPLSLLRAPNGISGHSFFQKHASPGMSSAIHAVKDKKDGEDLLFIKDFDGLAALVQLGTLEIHVWGSAIETVDAPDQVIFDLDPDPGVPVERVREAAADVRDRLKEVGFVSHLKTSGGKGFHVVVGLKPQADWTQVKTFAHDFAVAMEQAQPDRYTAVLSKRARKGRIFIDYLRNGRGATAIAPYSTRARPGAAVSMPVAWSMLPKLDPDQFTTANASRQMGKDDGWEEFFNPSRALKAKQRDT